MRVRVNPVAGSCYLSRKGAAWLSSIRAVKFSVESLNECNLWLRDGRGLFNIIKRLATLASLALAC